MDNSITIKGICNPVIGYSFIEYTTGDCKRYLEHMIAFYRYMMTYVNRYGYSKTEIKKVFECINNEKLKDYLFIYFNKATFQNTEKTRRFLSELKVGAK